MPNMKFNPLTQKFDLIRNFFGDDEKLKFGNTPATPDSNVYWDSVNSRLSIDSAKTFFTGFVTIDGTTTFNYIAKFSQDPSLAGLTSMPLGFETDDGYGTPENSYIYGISGSTVAGGEPGIAFQMGGIMRFVLSTDGMQYVSDSTTSVADSYTFGAFKDSVGLGCDVTFKAGDASTGGGNYDGGDLTLVAGQGAGTGATGNIVLSNSTKADTLTVSSGVYTDADKILTSTPPTSGALGYWRRTGTELTQSNANDSVDFGIGTLKHANAYGEKWWFAGSGINVEMNAGNTSWQWNVTGSTSLDKFRWFFDASGGVGNLLDLNKDGTARFYGNIIDDGLTANLGVYTDANKQLTSTAPVSGELGYWDRTGTTIRTATGNDDVVLGGKLGVNLETGDTPSSTFDVKGDIGFRIIPRPVSTMAYTLGSAGNVDDGVHRYKVTYVSSTGETDLSPAYLVVTVTDKTSNGQVLLTDIPISPDSEVISRRIYRGKVGYSTSSYYYVGEIADNTTTTYTDNIADADLPAGDYRNVGNRTAGTIFKDGNRVAYFGETNMSMGLGAYNPSGTPTGYFNFALGLYSLEMITTGNQNTAVGTYAAKNLENASNCCAIGSYALYSNIEAYDNIAIGSSASKKATTGYWTTSIGSSSLYNYNAVATVAIGHNAGISATDGSGGVVIGAKVLLNATTLTYMTAIGCYAGYSAGGYSANACTTSTNCTFLGALTGLGSTTQRTKSIAIGYKAVVDADNTCVIGGQGVEAVSLAMNQTTADASARVDIADTTKGVLFPRMTTVQKDAISSPAEGLIVYDLTLHKLCVYTTSWETITSS